MLVDWEIGCSLIGHARNKLAKRFIETKEAACLVYVDADISWPCGSLLKLAQNPLPVVGATYRGKTDVETFHVRGPVEAAGDFYRVTGLPGGFLKVSRATFDRIPAQRYENVAGTELRDYFPTGLADGVWYGEDYGFCRLWRETGGTVWLDPSIKLRHHDGCRFYTGDPAEWLKGFNG